MKRQSEKERTRRARRRELFAKGMCVHDCGRPAATGENICKICSDTLCAQYFARKRATKTRQVTGTQRDPNKNSPSE